MRYGITSVCTDQSLDVRELGRAAEDHGFYSLWLPEHTHIPTSRTTPYPFGGDLPEPYKRTLDPLVALAAVGSATSTLTLGTGILLVAQHDPVATAKAIATLDLLSKGRVRVGIGYGWNREEMSTHRVSPSTRRAQAREHVIVMQRLWKDEVATFEGKFASLPPTWQWPKPAQTVPVLVGGLATETVFRHIVEFGHGWIPTSAKGLDGHVSRLRDALGTAGRDPAWLDVVPFLAGVPSAAKVAALREAGATECVFEVPSAPLAVVLPALKELAALAESVEGAPLISVA